MARRKLEDGLVDEALMLCRAGASPQEAAAQLASAGKIIAWRTIHRARDRERKGEPAASRTTPAPMRPVAKGEPNGKGEVGKAGPPLTREQLEQLCSVAAFMPLEQQDVLLARLPLERMRREAIARALAPFPDAGQAVAREFRAVESSLR